jgi:DNA-directed RNA polymerase subunit RPC12/RpoP
MSMSVFCPKCQQLSGIALDQEDQLVYCQECDSQVTNITSFVKTNLKNSRTFRVKNKSNAAFQVVCAKCDKKDIPEIKGDDALCKHCNSKLSLTKQFIKTIKLLKK